MVPSNQRKKKQGSSVAPEVENTFSRNEILAVVTLEGGSALRIQFELSSLASVQLPKKTKESKAFLMQKISSCRHGLIH